MASIESKYGLKLDKPAKKGSPITKDLQPSSSSNEQMNNSFKCDKCGALSVTNPMVRGNRPKKGKNMPCPRRKIDPETNKMLCLCNACGEMNLIKKFLNTIKMISMLSNQQHLTKA